MARAANTMSECVGLFGTMRVVRIITIHYVSSRPLKREEEELQKINSGMGAVILKDLKEHAKYRKWKQSHMDPRKASRTPSASREPVYRLRYESPLGASPSRHLDHQKPFTDDETTTTMMFDRSTSYRGSVGRSIGQAPSYNGMSSVRCLLMTGTAICHVENGNVHCIFDSFYTFNMIYIVFCIIICFFSFFVGGKYPILHITLQMHVISVQMRTHNDDVDAAHRSHSLVPLAAEARLRLQNVHTAGVVDWLSKRL